MPCFGIWWKEVAVTQTHLACITGGFRGGRLRVGDRNIGQMTGLRASGFLVFVGKSSNTYEFTRSAEAAEQVGRFVLQWNPAVRPPR